VRLFYGFNLGQVISFKLVAHGIGLALPLGVVEGELAAQALLLLSELHHFVLAFTVGAVDPIFALLQLVVLAFEEVL